MLGEQRPCITATLLTQAVKTEGFQHSKRDVWGLQGRVPLLPYFASYCIRTFGFPISYFSYVTRNISTHDSHDKGVSWRGQGEHPQITWSGLRQKRCPFKWSETYWKEGRMERATETRTSMRKSTVWMQNRRCVSVVHSTGKVVWEQCLCTTAPTVGPAANSTGEEMQVPRHGLTSGTHAGGTPTVPHACGTKRRMCSGQQDSSSSIPLVRVWGGNE